MKIEGGSDLYQSQAKMILEISNTIFQSEKGSEPSCTIKITPDIKKDIYLFSSEKDKIHYDVSGVPDLNGFLTQPSSDDDLTFTILIAEKQFSDTQYVHTLIHELVHLHDYFRYYKENGNLYIKNKEEQDRYYFREFYYWSEFHAKVIGLLIFVIYLYQIEYQLEAPPDGKFSCTIDFQTKELEKSLDLFLLNNSSKRRNDLFWDFVLTLIGYYGRLCIIDSENPAVISDSDFPRDKILKAFGEPIIDLFPLLKSMDTYEKAIPCLPSLKYIFDKIVNKLNYDVSPWSFFESSLRDKLSTIHNEFQYLDQSLSQKTSVSSFLKELSNISQSSKSDSKKPR